MVSGRPPAGSKLLEGVQGSPEAKKKGRVILDQMAGLLSVADACEELDLTHNALHLYRRRMLEGIVTSLEPRPMGRPRKKTAESEEMLALRRRIAELESKLLMAEAKVELSHIYTGPSCKKKPPT